ncbi:hypothetical protein AB1M95_13715 [Sulfitobacter sp. LCG007]
MLHGARLAAWGPALMTAFQRPWKIAKSIYAFVMNTTKDEYERDEKKRAALCVQYEVLQNRIALHGSRLWQLPFTYVSFSAIAIPVALSNSSILPVKIFLYGLAVVGVLVTFCMTSAWRGYKRTGRNMNQVETKLGVGEYTRFGAWHAVPYFLLNGCVVFAIACLGFSVAQ